MIGRAGISTPGAFWSCVFLGVFCVFFALWAGRSQRFCIMNRPLPPLTCRWNKELGPVAYGENEEEVFLGRSVARQQNMSEETAKKVDSEIRKIVDKGYERARKILTEKIEDLHKLAKALLNNDKAEVIDAIGDMVVVLTNLAHLQGVHIETCIAEAYKVISKRTGKMINGTFVKDE